MTSELARRLAFTLGALLVFRLGTYIPLPGLNGAVLRELFSGGGIGRAAIFSLNVVPYVSAAIIVQLAMVASPRLRGLRKHGAQGRAIIERWTRCITVGLTALQSVGIASAYQSIPGVVTDPGWFFVVTTTLTLTAGTMFLVWLSAQITASGIGNGLALMLLAGFVTRIPAGIAGALEVGRQGLLSQKGLLALAAIVLVTVGLVVLMEQGRRHMPLRYAKREIGGVTYAQSSSFLTVKLNNAGVMPVVFASWLVGLPALGSVVSPRLADVASQLQPGRPFFLILYGLLVVFGAFFYTALVLDPDEIAGNLRQHRGAIADVEPGEATAAHVDHVVSRITVIGSVYLAAVCLLPFVLVVAADVPFTFGGPPLLLVVCTLLDLMAQLRAYGGARPVGSRR